MRRIGGLKTAIFPLIALAVLLSGGTACAQGLPAQIRVKANIWEIQETSSFDYGVVWDLEDFNPELNDLLESSIFLPGINSTASNPTGAFLTATKAVFHKGTLADEFRLTIQAAQREGSVQLRADPVITVIAGNQGIIHGGEEVPVIEWRAPNPRSPGTLVTVFKDTGIKLTVRPQVFRDDFVLMSIRPEVRDIIGFTEKDSNQGRFVLPVYSTRSVTSTVLVRSGGTIILSGMLSEQRLATTREVPYIADVPILGWLFRSRNKEWARSDILIEVTPTILKPGDSGYKPELIFESQVFQADSDVYNRVREAEEQGHGASDGSGPGFEWFEIPPAESGSTDTSSILENHRN